MHNVELINMGIPGIGPRNYLSLLVQEGFALDPDRVLVTFFIGNDFDFEAPEKKSRQLFVRSILDFIRRGPSDQIRGADHPWKCDIRG